MRVKICIFFYLIVGFSVYIYSGEEYKFRIKLKDKGSSSFSVDKPEEFLSEKAINRRLKHNIRIDETDLPISPEYIKAVEGIGCKVIAASKWVNTITIHCNDSVIVEKIRNLDFVESTELVWLGYTSDEVSGGQDEARTMSRSSYEYPTNHYGYGYEQLKMVNGKYLHDKGYEGEGIEIAVLDAGFTHMQENLLLDNISISGSKDFVYEKGGETMHGFRVLSLLAANKPGLYVGSAPKARYWLLRTEDERSESPVEEDYWVSAIEYADSVGADMVSSSLGYSRYSYPFKNHSWSDLDGKTLLISKAAEMATQKGIFVVNCAGNERRSDFGKISPPSDAEHVLTVGAVNKDSIISWFSSYGLTADYRIKPDVVALGEPVNFVNIDGSVYSSQGTSYSTPFICGMAACLWQAYPELTNLELLDIIRQSGHKYTNPDADYGYGIPNMEYAFELAGNIYSGIGEIFPKNPHFHVVADPAGYIRIKNTKGDSDTYRVTVISASGKLVLCRQFTGTNEDLYIPGFSKQVYVVNIRGNNLNYSQKVIL